MRRSLLVLALVGCTAGGFAARALAQDPAPPAPPAPADAAKAPQSAREQKVRKLLGLLDSERQAKVVLDKMLESFAQMPGLPPEFIEKFKKKADPKAMTELTIPVYVKHLDEPTLDAAIAYFETPLGAKYAFASQAIMTESMEVGSEWGRKLAMEVVQEIAEGK